MRKKLNFNRKPSIEFFLEVLFQSKENLSIIAKMLHLNEFDQPLMIKINLWVKECRILTSLDVVIRLAYLKKEKEIK